MRFSFSTPIFWYEEDMLKVYMRHYCTTGHGTGSGKFDYTGEARKIFSNSVIKTEVLMVLGSWSTHKLILCWFNRRCTAVQCLQGYAVVLMVYTGTPAARGSGVGKSRVTWAVLLSIHRERCTPITSYNTFSETVIMLCGTYFETVIILCHTKFRT